MPKSEKEHDDELRAVFDRGVAESQRRNAGEFDGLMGSFQGAHSELLTDICHYLRNYLLDRCAADDVRGLVCLKRPPGWNDSPEELARALMKEYFPREGFRWVTPVPDDVELVLGLVNMISSAMTIDNPERRAGLILGTAGVRGKSALAAVRKPRRSRMPLLDEWLDGADLEQSSKVLFRRLERNSDGDDLFTDGSDVCEMDKLGKCHTIGFRAFERRVTEARKRVTKAKNQR